MENKEFQLQQSQRWPLLIQAFALNRFYIVLGNAELLGDIEPGLDHGNTAVLGIDHGQENDLAVFQWDDAVWFRE